MADFFNDIYENINKDIDERYQKFEEENSQKPKFDMLKMYFGEDLVINEYIKVTQPTIGQILQDEKALWSSISPFTGNTTTYRVMLWQANLDWCKISNWEMFLLLYKSLTPDITWLIFDSYDFSKLEINGSEDGTMDLRDDEGHIVLNEISYVIIQEYLRSMFNQHPKDQFAKGKSTKQAIINKEIREQKERAMKETSSGSILLPMVSSLLNHPGFKYKKSELREVGYVEFMDSVQRLMVYEQAKAFQNGMYSGMMDVSKMSQEALNDSVNWMRDIHAYSN